MDPGRPGLIPSLNDEAEENGHRRIRWALKQPLQGAHQHLEILQLTEAGLELLELSNPGLESFQFQPSQVG
jgi:hypothetical protein